MVVMVYNRKKYIRHCINKTKIVLWDITNKGTTGSTQYV